MNGQLLWEWRRCRWQHQHEGQWAYRRSSSVRGGDAGCDFYLVITVNQLMTRVNTCRQDPENSLWKHEKSSMFYCLTVSLCELKLLKKKKKERDVRFFIISIFTLIRTQKKKANKLVFLFIYFGSKRLWKAITLFLWQQNAAGTTPGKPWLHSSRAYRWNLIHTLPVSNWI